MSGFDEQRVAYRDRRKDILSNKEKDKGQNSQVDGDQQRQRIEFGICNCIHLGGVDQLILAVSPAKVKEELETFTKYSDRSNPPPSGCSVLCF